MTTSDRESESVLIGRHGSSDERQHTADRINCALRVSRSLILFGRLSAARFSVLRVIRPELRNLESSPPPVFAECIGDLSLFEIKGCVEVGLARSERVGSQG
jgi:hypothetical protein